MADARRARSAERLRQGELPETAMLGRLTDILERMWDAPRPEARPHFKAPQYEGSGDIDYFIQQFQDVALANQWNQGATLLHLREALKEGARDCGRPGNIAGIYEALRARYGCSPREARTRLAGLKKDFKTALPEHAIEVQRLVRLAYADLPDRNQVAMALEIFANTLGNTYLQRHLLAVDPQDLESAVRAGNEYLQIRPRSDRGGPHSAVRAIDEEPEVRVQPVTEPDNARLAQVLTKLVEQMEQLQSRMNSPRGPASQPRQEKKPGCWGCGKLGHDRRDCPTHPWTATKKAKTSGNDNGPQ